MHWCATTAQGAAGSAGPQDLLRSGDGRIAEYSNIPQRLVNIVYDHCRSGTPTECRKRIDRDGNGEGRQSLGMAVARAHGFT